MVASTFFFRYVTYLVSKLQATLGMTEATHAPGTGGEEDWGAGIAGAVLFCAWSGKLGSTG